MGGRMAGPSFINGLLLFFSCIDSCRFINWIKGFQFQGIASMIAILLPIFYRELAVFAVLEYCAGAVSSKELTLAIPAMHSDTEPSYWVWIMTPPTLLCDRDWKAQAHNIVVAILLRTRLALPAIRFEKNQVRFIDPR